MALVSGLLWVPTARAETENDIWSSADVINLGGIEDFYRWGAVQIIYWCWSGQFWFPCWSDIEDGYAGQMKWEWRIERIESTNPDYDFYAIYLLFKLSPSSALANPDPGAIEWADYKHTGASAKLDLWAGQQVAHYKPDSSIGTTSLAFGVSVGANPSGPMASFTVTQTYAVPQVDISAGTDSNLGGYQSWNMGFSGESRAKQYNFELTTLVAVTEGTTLEFDLLMNWGLVSEGCQPYYVIYRKCHYESFGWSKSLRVYFPPDVSFTSATTGGCQAVNLAWTQYTGKYFSKVRVYYKGSSAQSWAWYANIYSATQTSISVEGLSGSTQHDFQLRWETTHGSLIYSSVLSATSGPQCVSSSQFISQTPPPAAVSKGSSYSVSVTMKNTGTTVWSPSGTNPYRLGSQNPQDNSVWGLSRVSLTGSVSPGQTHTFSFTVTAPSTGGTYNFQWRMVQEGVQWFGEFSPNVQVIAYTTAKLEGYVKNSGGSPISGTGVAVTFPSGSTSTVTTNSTGYYSITVDALGTYRLTVQASGYTSNCRSRAVSAFGNVYRVDFNLSSGTGSIGPIRVMGGGEPVPNARVTVRDCFGTQVWSGSTDSTGNATGVSGLTHGTFTISASWTDWSECDYWPHQAWIWLGSATVVILPNAAPAVVTNPEHTKPCPV